MKLVMLTRQGNYTSRNHNHRRDFINFNRKHFDINHTNSPLLKVDPGKAGESQSRAQGQASDYTLRGPNHLDSSTHDQTFYQDFGPL